MKAQGLKVEIAPRREGRVNVSATPLGAFGRDYYCQPGLWPEACRGGRWYGPVAPDGHPKRAACERVFLEAPCPYWKSEGEPGPQFPLGYDPYYVINGTNQNHPRNRKCGEDDWYKIDGNGMPVRGSWWLASAHGIGYPVACNADKSVCTKASFKVDH